MTHVLFDITEDKWFMTYDAANLEVVIEMF